ncbi:unnamed protein product [Arabidopsis thaliana]|uniref:(thale cress) hypothetical protein n=1 Tax=Arabidopsis thaliana TaxID=3702 RepID=A0A7G2EUA6_ARATH|nr:unnamed protein product [Arabidopsis thaliana]
MSENLTSFLNYPWGCLTFEMTMKSIKEREIEQLATTSLAVQGLLYVLQLVVLQAAPAIQEGPVSEETVGSESDEVTVELNPVRLFRLNSTRVDPIIRPDVVLDPAQDLSWAVDEVDPRVDAMVKLASEGSKFNNDMFPGGCVPSEIVVAPKKHKRNAISKGGRGRKASKKVIRKEKHVPAPRNNPLPLFDEDDDFDTLFPVRPLVCRSSRLDKDSNRDTQAPDKGFGLENYVDVIASYYKGCFPGDCSGSRAAVGQSFQGCEVENYLGPKTMGVDPEEVGNHGDAEESKDGGVESNGDGNGEDDEDSQTDRPMGIQDSQRDRPLTIPESKTGVQTQNSAVANHGGRRSKRKRNISSKLDARFQFDKKTKLLVGHPSPNATPSLDPKERFNCSLKKLKAISSIALVGDVTMNNKDILEHVLQTGEVDGNKLRVDVLDTKFISQLCHLYPKFCKAHVPQDFQFPTSLVDAIAGVGDFDRLQLFTNIMVLDCNIHLRIDASLKTALEPLSRMLPILFRQSALNPTMTQLLPTPYSVERSLCIQQVIDHVDAGLMTIFLIHAHVVGGMDDCLEFSPDCIETQTKKLVSAFILAGVP